MPITLIRHAQSKFNAHGDTTPNVGLTDEGKLASSQNLKGEYDLVICSTLRRARETLDHSNIKYKKVKFTELCRECFDENNPINFYDGEDVYAETPLQLAIRVGLFKDMLRKKLVDHNNIAVISHHGFLHHLTGFSFGNCQYLLNYEVQ